MTKTDAKPKAWKNRIVGRGEEPASSFLANEKNWRIHPKDQQDGLSGVLDDIGWIQDVIVNRRTSPEWGRDQNVETMVDGHLRVSLALSKGDDTPVPVIYVDLKPKEEAMVLATLDPLAGMAVTDSEKLSELLGDIGVSNELLRSIAAREGLISPDYVDDSMGEWQGMPEYHQEDQQSYRRLIVHFDCEDDVQDFARIIGQSLTDKTKYVWHPAKEHKEVKDLRYG